MVLFYIIFLFTNGQQLAFKCQIGNKYLNLDTYILKRFLKFDIDIIKQENRLNDYCVIHIRLGDSHMNSYQDRTSMFSDLLKKINKIKKRKIIISDSIYLKIFLNEHNIICSNNYPCHFGHSTDTHEMVDIINDQYLVMKSSCIYYYSTYKWISGFIMFTSLCYSIPIYKL